MAFAMRLASSEVRWVWPNDHFCRSSRQCTAANRNPFASRTSKQSALTCWTRQGGGNRRFCSLDICAFNSELFYEGRLKSRPGLERQQIKSDAGLKGSGLRYLPVQHDGNQSSSPEEADAIRDLVSDILESRTTWVDRSGKESTITLDDVLIIAPYNAQVFELQERIPGACIGTVDKFQGQEAPIVIYSMSTSSYADAPRGMEFLYSANRLNVAVSRAMCICIVVASPRLFEAECRTPRQMQLANGFCRYAELASPL